jgi:hypothetical protein
MNTFHFPGGPANPIRQIITGTSATVINIGASGAEGRQIVYFRCSEYAGGTPNLTVEIFDGTTSYYLGSNSFTWKAKAVTALQSLLFDDGYVIPQGSSLRVTASVGSQILVTGIYVGRQRDQSWRPLSGASQ